MSVPTVESNIPATPNVTLALPFGVPGWNLGAGTWYFRVSFVDDMQPGTRSLSVWSNEVSITLVAGQSPFLAWDNGIPGRGVILWASLVSGTYGLPYVKSADDTPVLEGTSGGFVNFAVKQPAGAWFQNLRTKGHPSQLIFYGGTDGDPVTPREMVDAAEVHLGGGDTFIMRIDRPFDVEFPQLRRAAYEFLGDVVLGKAGQASRFQFNDELIVVAGTFQASGNQSITNDTHITLGQKTGDGQRFGGPTLVFLYDGVPDLVNWICKMTAYDFAFVDGSAWVDPAFVEFDAWFHRRGSFRRLPSLAFLPAEDSVFESGRFEGFGVVDIAVSFDPDPLLNVTIKDLGTHAVDELAGRQKVEGVRIEGGDLRCTSIFPITRSHFIAEAVRVVARDTMDCNFEATINNTGRSGYRLIDCVFEETGDDNDPIVRLNSQFRTGLVGGQVPEITIEKTVNLQVLDHLGIGVPGVTVSMTSAAGTVLFSVVTDAAGRIAEQTVQRDVYEAAWDAATWAANGGEQTAALSAHVAAGTLTLAGNRKIKLIVARPGHDPEVILSDLDKPLDIIVTTHFGKTADVSASIGPVELAATVAPLEVHATVSEEDIAAIVGPQEVDGGVD